MTRLTSFLAIVTLCCFTSSADAQVRSSTAEQLDTAQVEAISIADLEMIVPENRLIPETVTDRTGTEQTDSGYIESPFSSTHWQSAYQPDAMITSKDIEMLESVSPTEQAEDAPSR